MFYINQETCCSRATKLDVRENFVSFLTNYVGNEKRGNGSKLMVDLTLTSRVGLSICVHAVFFTKVV